MLPRMTTRRTTKRTFEPITQFLRQTLPRFGHLISRRIIALLILVLMVGANSAPARGGSQAQSNSHAHDFVIFATVFTEQGLALPDAHVRVRREDEKKFRWEAMSDRRGELGIRVKQGAEYELTIEARGFKPQTRKIDAREGNREDLTLQMERLAGGKP
jgi:Carboxypeptidase regulatory-like domain